MAVSATSSVIISAGAPSVSTTRLTGRFSVIGRISGAQPRQHRGHVHRGRVGLQLPRFRLGRVEQVADQRQQPGAGPAMRLTW